MSFRATAFTLAAASLALAACDRRPSDAELAKLDNQLVGNQSDPALTNALEDPILVDPTLSQQSNKMAARPPASAPQAQYPLPDKEQAAGTARSRPAGARQGAPAPDAQAAATGACGGKFNYGPNWANRLPGDFAVYPGARITEAAGNAGDCRVVVFASADAPQRLLDWYRSRAVRAGYSSEHQARGSDHVLAGTRGDGAYYLIVSPSGRGAQGALIVNQGR